MADDILKRKGIVKIQTNIFMKMGQKQMEKVFSQMYPMAITSSTLFADYDIIAYFALSPQFEAIGEGERAPEYELEMKELNNGQLEYVKFTKIPND